MNGLNRRDFLRVMAAAGAGLAGVSKIFAVETAAKKPNFVFILIDDMGWTDVGCFGSKFYQTPNIDKLAAQGMRFTDAYAACPVCSPTRASIMTGKYPARLHLTDYIPGDQASEGKPWGSEKFIAPEFEQQLPLQEVTIAEALKQVGYATCYLGKWHLGTEEFYPDKQGFDSNIGGSDRGSPPSYFYPYGRGERSLPGLEEGRQGEYLTDRLTDEAIRFIEGNKDKPFFLYLAHYAVHKPIQAKRELIAKYAGKLRGQEVTAGADYRAEKNFSVTKLKQDDPMYAAMVESVDESVGRVMDKLAESGMEENTIVIFVSDNGGLSTHGVGSVPTSNMPLRAGKGWLYEGGIREPMIVRWPGVVKPGSSCPEAVTSTDFYPTILEMAGMPLEPEHHKDGRSLVSLLKGEGKIGREAIYWHYPHYHSSGSRPSGAVRAGRFKLIEWYEDDRIELYDLEKDVGEMNDLAYKMPEKAAAMREMLHSWLRSVGASMPVKLNPHYDPNIERRYGQ